MIIFKFKILSQFHIYSDIAISCSEYYNHQSDTDWLFVNCRIYFLLIYFFCRCNTCGHTLEANQIREGHDRLTSELKSLDRTRPAHLEDFLQKYATILPDTNQLAREIQYSIMLIYR